MAAINRLALPALGLLRHIGDTKHALVALSNVGRALPAKDGARGAPDAKHRRDAGATIFNELSSS
jgi:hypothetical protein